MRTTANAGLLNRKDMLPSDGVTVLVPGAVLAPAPTPQVAEVSEAPVFVDDSGNRKRLLRLAGVLVALLSISFLAIVGVALAVPNVATSVGLGNVVPFIVPGAAAPPPPKAPPAPRVQAAKPKAKVKATVVAAPTAKPKPAEVDTKPATDAQPNTQDGTTDTTGTDTTGTGTTGTGTTGTGTTGTGTTGTGTTQTGGTQTGGTTQTGGNTQTNGTAQTDGTPAKGGQAPVANLPGADANGVTGDTGVPADQAVQN
jgi:hypothetical protein